MKKINLSNIPRQDPYAIPDGYLESLPGIVQERVIRQPAQQGSYDASMLQLLPRLQFAFSMLVLLVLSVLVLNRPTDNEPDAQAILNATSEQDVVTYLNSNSKLYIIDFASASDINNNNVNYIEGIDSKELLENEILQNIDSYTAEDLW